MRAQILTFLLLFALPVFAAGQPNMVEIDADVTASSAAEARTIAMNRAYRQAVNKIALNFTTNQGILVLDALTDEQLQNFIKETVVQDEKTSSVRYMAKLKISVHDDILKQYLEEKEAAIIPVSSEDVIVVPVLRNHSGVVLLWEDENSWRKVWENGKLDMGGIRFRPLDTRYASMINPDNVLNINNKTYTQISIIEGTSNVYVLDAGQTDLGQININIINPLNSKTDIFTVNQPVDAQTGLENEPNSEQLLQKAGYEISLIISDGIKNLVGRTFEQKETVSVLYNYNVLTDWINLQQDIQNLAPVENIEVVAIGGGKVQFRIEFAGSIDNLSRTMYQNYLLLEPHGNFYVVTKNN